MKEDEYISINEIMWQYKYMKKKLYIFILRLFHKIDELIDVFLQNFDNLDHYLREKFSKNKKNGKNYYNIKLKMIRKAMFIMGTIMI